MAGHAHNLAILGGLVKFKSILSLNVSVAGSIVMYDRQTKMKQS